jgi:hypothetical protein
MEGEGEPGRVGVLEQVAGGASAEGVEQVGVGLRPREHHHGRVGHGVDDLGGGSDAAARHADVDEADVRPLTPGRGHCGRGISHLADHQEPAPVQCLPGQDAARGIVVGDETRSGSDDTPPDGDTRSITAPPEAVPSGEFPL